MWSEQTFIENFGYSCKVEVHLLMSTRTKITQQVNISGSGYLDPTTISFS